MKTVDPECPHRCLTTLEEHTVRRRRRAACGKHTRRSHERCRQRNVCRAPRSRHRRAIHRRTYLKLRRHGATALSVNTQRVRSIRPEGIGRSGTLTGCRRGHQLKRCAGKLGRRRIRLVGRRRTRLRPARHRRHGVAVFKVTVAQQVARIRCIHIHNRIARLIRHLETRLRIGRWPHRQTARRQRSIHPQCPAKRGSLGHIQCPGHVRVAGRQRPAAPATTRVSQILPIIGQQVQRPTHLDPRRRVIDLVSHETTILATHHIDVAIHHLGRRASSVQRGSCARQARGLCPRPHRAGTVNSRVIRRIRLSSVIAKTANRVNIPIEHRGHRSRLTRYQIIASRSPRPQCTISVNLSVFNRSKFRRNTIITANAIYIAIRRYRRLPHANRVESRRRTPRSQTTVRVKLGVIHRRDSTACAISPTHYVNVSINQRCRKLSPPSR